jgi:hypothetical protein
MGYQAANGCAVAEGNIRSTHRFPASLECHWLGTSESLTLEHLPYSIDTQDVDHLNSIERWNCLRLNHSSRREISSFSRTLLRHFRITVSDATDDRSEVTYFSSFGGASLALIGAVTGSTTRIALVCGSPVSWFFICERSGSCYCGAVFAGDDLAV